MALNAPQDALIHTLDLPSLETTAPVDPFDLKYVRDEEKNERKFRNTKVAHKIHQHLGDSTNYDFTLFGNADFIFIYSSQSYICVKSDTENAFRILASGGVILWHDDTPIWPGVWSDLQKLATQLPLIHIKNSTLVYFKLK